MGQRLNIEIGYKDKVLANCYYHWSGYTTSAFALTRQIIEYFSTIGPVNSYNMFFLAVKSLEHTGARLSCYEARQARKIDAAHFPYRGTYKYLDRNDGLISVSKRGITETMRWAEADVIIDLYDNTVDMCGVFYVGGSKEDYIDDGGSAEDFDSLDKKHIEFKVKFDELDSLYNLVCHSIEWYDHVSDTVYGLI